MVVRGRVQGVGYRAYVLRSANVLGVSGEVWNCASGDVELVASHENEEVLSAFARLLKTGPGDVKVIESQQFPEQAWAGFSIGPTR